ncbi:MAG: hypothetical protein U0441_38300 [Polyangiaceae bacterium]
MHLLRRIPWIAAFCWSVLPSAALLTACCDKPPCTDPHTPGCTPDGGGGAGAACPTIADLASGAAIPDAPACSIPVWICALDKDFLDAKASGTFIDDNTYRDRWAAHVEKGWLPLAKRIQTEAGTNQGLSNAAWSLESKVTKLTGSADDRRKLVEDGYLLDRARELYDVAAAIPGLAPACQRP